MDRTKPKRDLTYGLMFGIGMFVVITIVLIVYYNSPRRVDEPDTPSVHNLQECNPGDSEPCTVDGCPGSRVCISGEWSTCRREPIDCVPGSKRRCPLGGCRWGVQYCDRCGRWGVCQPV